MDLFFAASIFFAKLIDIHVMSPKEKHEHDQNKKQYYRERDNRIRQNPKASDSKKGKAIKDMFDRGDIS